MVDLEVVVLAGVVDLAVVVVLAVVDLAVVVLGVVFGCRLRLFTGVQEAVTVTSVIGTNELQNAEALRATRTALHTATLSRASMSERPRLAAELKSDSKPRTRTLEDEEIYMIILGVGLCNVKLRGHGA